MHADLGPFCILGTEVLSRPAGGFTRRMIASLSRAGLATARGKTVKVGDNAIAAGRVRITAAGRTALEG